MCHDAPDANAESGLREAVPSEDFVREMCHDARDLVMGCAVHLAVHLASSTTRKESLKSADTISTMSLASRQRITQRSGADERVSSCELVWRSYERPSMAWLEES